MKVTLAGLFGGYICRSLCRLHWQVSFNVTLAGLFYESYTSRSLYESYIGNLHGQVTLAGLFYESYIGRSL